MLQQHETCQAQGGLDMLFKVRKVDKPTSGASILLWVFYQLMELINVTCPACMQDPAVGSPAPAAAVQQTGRQCVGCSVAACINDSLKTK